MLTDRFSHRTTTHRHSLQLNDGRDSFSTFHFLSDLYPPRPRVDTTPLTYNNMSRPATGRSGSSPPGSPAGRAAHLAPGGGVSAAGLSSPTSPRSSFLGNFMRGRSRAASVTNAVAGAVRGRVGSPTVEQPNPLGGDVTRSVSTPNSGGDAQTVNIPPVDPALRRTHRIRLVPVLETNRSFTFAPVLRELGVMHVPPGILPAIAAASVSDVGPTVNGRPPPLLIKIGRFTDRSAAAAAATTGASGAAVPAAGAAPGAASEGAVVANGGLGVASNGGDASFAPPAPSPASVAGGGGGDLLSPRAAFKSKVVSRSHAEIWCEPGGKVSDLGMSIGLCLLTLLVLYPRHRQFIGHLPQPHSSLEPQCPVSPARAQGRRRSPAGC